ncbi:uncharacterized protein LOC131625862 [Vicia villosa]|uniref:uncharacterized protein LOC131625862 n=1 Tax=Vicia villosa TaxID=3911 RepID=UPI00273C0E2B|nr:uncharacterized protein LOC131625862 [Vicia villosa]
MTNKDNSSKGRKLSRYMKAPLRFMIKVKNMYVNGMIQCSRDLAYVDHTAMGCPTQFYSLPRSFSVNSTSSDDDFKELVRVASRTLSDENRAELISRSRSVGIGRIEEDKEYEFGADDDIKVKPLLYSRSRSCAIRSNRGTML